MAHVFPNLRMIEDAGRQQELAVEDGNRADNSLATI